MTESSILSEDEKRKFFKDIIFKDGLYVDESTLSRQLDVYKLHYFIRQGNQSYFLISRPIGIYNSTITCIGGKMMIIENDSIYTLAFEKVVANTADKDSVDILFKRMMSK